MRYVGGKARIARWIRDHIVSVADEYRGIDLTYVEPFVGSGAVLERVVRSRRFSRHIASDVHPDLIRMWHALSREGWRPPEYVDLNEYRSLQNSGVSSALRGYAGFACSYGGKFFGGHEYRRKRSESPNRDGSPGGGGQDTERRNVIRIGKTIGGVELRCSDYEELRIPVRSIVYCDPPYLETSGYDCGDFDHERFWRVADKWVAHGAIVFVSEYRGPWQILDEHQRQAVLGHSVGDRRTERLYLKRP
jgi:DNA adenine methylase